MGEKVQAYLKSYEDEDEYGVDFAEKVDKVEKGLPPKSNEFYFQEYNYVRPKQSDFDRKKVKEAELFEGMKVNKEQSGETDEDIQRDASILVSGFGMRNVRSFQRLIKMSQEERRKWELKKLWRDQSIKLSISREEERRQKTETITTDTSGPPSSIETATTRSTSDFLTQTESTTKLDILGEGKKHLDYLLGLETEMEEEEIRYEVKEKEKEEADAFEYSTSKSIREAQKYLRSHRIFEFFQFIVAHLLSSKTDNPIDFILKLLNQCLLYRSGMGKPPLLYKKTHIHQLFHLMDRMRTGYVEKAQYVTGMKTLGICSFNENPETADEGLITEEVFVEEIYNAELAIFDDMIKRRPTSKPLKPPENIFDTVSLRSRDPPFFIPSSLFKFSKRLLPPDDG